jgi:hypothetical protein
MRRGATPTYTIEDTDVVFSQVDDVVLSFVQKDSDGNVTHSLFLLMSQDRVHKDTENETFYATLTQEETLAFNKGSVRIQYEFKMTDGTVMTSDITKEQVYDVQYDKVI